MLNALVPDGEWPVGCLVCTAIQILMTVDPASGFLLFARSLFFPVALVPSLIAPVIHRSLAQTPDWEPWRDVIRPRGAQKSSGKEHPAATVLPHLALTSPCITPLASSTNSQTFLYTRITWGTLKNPEIQARQLNQAPVKTATETSQVPPVCSQV